MQCCEIIRTEIPQMVEISEVVSEGKGQKSFFFKGNIDCKPGQFVMVWLPEVDEKPMAISYWKKNEFAFTSQAVGKFTDTLDKLRKGDKLGVRGPYGNSFWRLAMANKKLSDKTKKNLLDLEYNKYLQYYNTSIIVLLTYIIGTTIAFLTKQINYKDSGQLLSVAVVSIVVIGVIIILMLKFKDNLTNISKEIEKLKL